MEWMGESVQFYGLNITILHLGDLLESVWKGVPGIHIRGFPKKRVTHVLDRSSRPHSSTPPLAWFLFPKISPIYPPGNHLEQPKVGSEISLPVSHTHVTVQPQLSHTPEASCPCGWLQSESGSLECFLKPYHNLLASDP